MSKTSGKISAIISSKICASLLMFEGGGFSAPVIFRSMRVEENSVDLAALLFPFSNVIEASAKRFFRKFGFDTAVNEPSKSWQSLPNVGEDLQKCQLPAWTSAEEAALLRADAAEAETLRPLRAELGQSATSVPESSPIQNKYVRSYQYRVCFSVHVLNYF